MMNPKSMRSFLISTFLALLIWGQVSDASAQRRRGNRDMDGRAGVPNWENDTRFKNDVFTFVRIEYSSGYRSGRGWGGRGGWETDYPDADLNFSYRLQELTSLKVDPNGLILELTDKRLFDYPFIYIIEPGSLRFREAEVTALRKYLLGGGFLMVDDFWGEDEYANLYGEMKRVFPDRDVVDLDISHPIFNTVFPLKETLGKLPQIPNVRTGTNSQYDGVTWERWDAEEPHYRGISDDKGRLMTIICHNTDLGDGWEEEGTDPYYFREFSEKKAYPLGINIVFYAMTN